MRCPTLNELPPPPEGKTGWPWTKESQPLPERMPDGHLWPRISIVTPSYNQGQFIEETIRSVLLQGYPDLEYMVIDGQSTDNTVEIIKRYQPWLTYWVSEPDRGQSQAINKGLQRASGEFEVWINSDDLYCPNALAAIIQEAHIRDADVIWGNTEVVDNKLSRLYTKDWHFYTKKTLKWGVGTLPQPAVLWRRKARHIVGNLREELHLAMDTDFWMRMAQQPNLVFSGSSKIIAMERIHPEQKVELQSVVLYAELGTIFRSYHPRLWEAWKLLFLRRLHLRRHWRTLNRILTDMRMESAVFRNGAQADRLDSFSWELSHLGFLFSFYLLNCYLVVAKASFRLFNKIRKL